MSRRKPVSNLVMSGGYRADRHANRHELTFRHGAKCPSWLDAEAKKEWKRIAPELEAQGILTSVSAQILASYCSSFAHWKQSEAEIQKNGLVISIQSTTRTGQTIKPVPNPAVKNYLTVKRLMLESAAKFGLDPLSSQRVDAVPQQPAREEDDPLATLLET